MTMFISFLTVLAWVMMALSGILTVGRIYGAMTYSQLAESLDRMNGVKRTFPIVKSGIIFVVSVSWLIATWV